MHTYYDLREMLHDELAEIVKKGELSAGSLDTIDKLLNSVKNTYKITMYERYEGDGEYSRDTIGAGMTPDRSYAGARRDSKGRYMRSRYSRGYSYADDKHAVTEMLRDMMDEASTDEERAVLKKLMRRMDQG